MCAQEGANLILQPLEREIDRRDDVRLACDLGLQSGEGLLLIRESCVHCFYPSQCAELVLIDPSDLRPNLLEFHQYGLERQENLLAEQHHRALSFVGRKSVQTLTPRSRLAPAAHAWRRPPPVDATPAYTSSTGNR